MNSEQNIWDINDVDDFRFANANNIYLLKNYLQDYPNGKHVVEARIKILQLQEDVIGRIEQCQDIEECVFLLNRHKRSNSAIINKTLDDKFFSLCKKSKDYQFYIEQLGDVAIHKADAKKIIKRKQILVIVWMWLIAIGALGILVLYLKCTSEYQQSLFAERAEKKYLETKQSNNTIKIIEYLSDNPDCEVSRKDSLMLLLNSLIKEEADGFKINMDNDVDSMKSFLAKYANYPIVSDNDDINRVKDLLEEEQYGTDNIAWFTAVTQNTISEYKEYLARYPNGKYVTEANSKIVDLEVQHVIDSGGYGYLPSSHKISTGTGPQNTIRIRSRCDRTITIMYSGNKSVKIVLAPYQSESIILPSGKYTVVATSPKVRPFLGTETLNGGVYELEYYIEE